MAIDTAEKRRSVSSLITGVFAVAVTPNAAQDLEWRQQAGWGYSGINPNGPIDTAEITRSIQMILKPGRWFV